MLLVVRCCPKTERRVSGFQGKCIWTGEFQTYRALERDAGRNSQGASGHLTWLSILESLMLGILGLGASLSGSCWIVASFATVGSLKKQGHSLTKRYHLHMKSSHKCHMIRCAMELALGCGWKWEREECGPQLMTNESKLKVNCELGLCLEKGQLFLPVEGQC